MNFSEAFLLKVKPLISDIYHLKIVAYDMPVCTYFETHVYIHTFVHVQVHYNPYQLKVFHYHGYYIKCIYTRM